MNVITKALSEVGYSIPLEILELAFIEGRGSYKQTISLDERMMNKVIRPRVLIDCNLVGGVQAVIPINKCTVEYGSNNEAIITVGKHLTNNKSILSALSLVTNISSNLTGSVNDPGNAMLGTGVNILNGLDDLNVTQTAKLELIADNKILVEEYGVGFIDGAVRCMIENSTNLSNISPRSSSKFSKLVVLAIKAYIYNNQLVKLGKGYLYNGHDLGVIKEIVDGYSDANEMYTDYLETVWREVAFMNDGMTHDRYIKSMLGSAI